MKPFSSKVPKEVIVSDFFIETTYQNAISHISKDWVVEAEIVHSKAFIEKADSNAVLNKNPSQTFLYSNMTAFNKNTLELRSLIKPIMFDSGTGDGDDWLADLFVARSWDCILIHTQTN
jgi:hypothetical protein